MSSSVFIQINKKWGIAEYVYTNQSDKNDNLSPFGTSGNSLSLNPYGIARIKNYSTNEQVFFNYQNTPSDFRTVLKNTNNSIFSTSVTPSSPIIDETYQRIVLDTAKGLSYPTQDYWLIDDFNDLIKTNQNYILSNSSKFLMINTELEDIKVEYDILRVYILKGFTFNDYSDGFLSMVTYDDSITKKSFTVCGNVNLLNDNLQRVYPELTIGDRTFDRCYEIKIPKIYSLSKLCTDVDLLLQNKYQSEMTSGASYTQSTIDKIIDNFSFPTIKESEIDNRFTISVAIHDITTSDKTDLEGDKIITYKILDESQDWNTSVLQTQNEFDMIYCTLRENDNYDYFDFGLFIDGEEFDPSSSYINEYFPDSNFVIYHILYVKEYTLNDTVGEITSRIAIEQTSEDPSAYNTFRPIIKKSDSKFAELIYTARFIDTNGNIPTQIIRFASLTLSDSQFKKYNRKLGRINIPQLESGNYKIINKIITK